MTGRLCGCGCGQETPIASRTRSSRGWVKGEPKPYCSGHRPGAPNLETATTSKTATLGKLADLLDRSGIPLDEIGQVQRVNVWQGFLKDQDGNPQVVDLAGIQLVPKWADGPAWPVVQQATPVTISTHAVKPRIPDGWERAVILPDLQIGYRQLRGPAGSYLDPFHDEAAIACALGVVADVQPDRIILLGDSLDFPGQSKYIQDPTWALTTQDAIDRFYRLLAELRTLCPAATIEVLEGNHDLRLPRSIQINAAASFRLHRAQLPESWPVLTVPHLCRFDEVGVTYIDSYPSGRIWVNDRLCCLHGHKVRSNGSTAAAVIDDERVSTIFGHVHRIELHHKTRQVRDGSRQLLAASPGCLCRIDGGVPSVKSNPDSWGKPRLAAEDWQHGCAVVTYQPGDGPFGLELVPIHDGVCVFRGRVIAADQHEEVAA